MSEVATRALTILETHHALQLATTGGPYSPWLLTIYFSNEELRIFSFVEKSGKTMANLLINPEVAFMVSDNDAQKDFLQGKGSVRLLDDSHSPKLRALLEKRMPWFQTYTPVTPVCIEAKEIFVSSFSSGWFPAKALQVP